MFNKMTIRTKLISSFLIVAIIAGVIGTIGYNRIMFLDDRDTELYEVVALPLGTVAQINEYFQRIRVEYRDVIISDDIEFKKEQISLISTNFSGIDSCLKVYEKSIRTDNGKEIFARTISSKNDFQTAVSKFNQMALSPDITKEELVSEIRNGDMYKYNKEFQAQCYELLSNKVNRGKQVSEENTVMANTAGNLMLLFVAIGVILAIILGFVMSSNIGAIIKSIIEETNKLVKAAVNGKLDTRGKPEEINFEFREIIVGINKTLDAVIGPLNVAAEYVDRISKGDVPPKIIDTYNGDFNEIKNNLNMCIDAINLMVDDAKILAKAAVAGQLATRADATKHQGDFRVIVQGVNDTLDAVINPLNVSAEYVERISKGDIPPKITDNYNGDFNEIKNNLNMCIDAVNLLVIDANVLSKAAVAGQLSTRADATKHQGDFRKIVQGVNDTLDSVINPLNVAAEYVDRIAKGDIPPKITDNYNGDFNEIKNNLNMCIDAINALVVDINILTDEAVEGRLDTRADAAKHQGDFKKIIRGINDTLDAILIPIGEGNRVLTLIRGGNLREEVTITCKGDHEKMKNSINGVHAWLKELIAYVTKIANGDLTANMTKASNDDQIHEWLVILKNNINALVLDAKMLATSAVAGQLATRADATKHQGDFRAIIQGVNDTLDAVIGPLNVAAEYVDRISKGDMPEIIIDNYNGDFNLIKNNLNVLINALNEITDKAKLVANGDLTISLEKRSVNDELMQSLTEMVKSTAKIIEDFKTAANNISNASQQMSATSQDMSQGATEQASSAEEVSSSMEQMSSNIQQNTENAQQTEKIAVNSAEGINKVAAASNETLEKMRDIAEKVSIIGEIARQTNILALNAAVEAARAGEHGKGFAVVAAEVRKLAERSQSSAVEIDALTKVSVKTTEEAVKMMNAIAPEIQKTAKLVQEITAASIEQTSGAEQVNNALQQLNKVTQQNAAASEEMATGSEELSGQADQLLETISFFKLENNIANKMVFQKPKNIVSKQISGINVRNLNNLKNPKTKTTNGAILNMGKDFIDNEFERF